MDRDCCRNLCLLNHRVLGSVLIRPVFSFCGSKIGFDTRNGGVKRFTPSGQNGPRPSANARRDFKEWACLFTGELFVKVVAYVDESGCHDRTGRLEGSSVAVMTGFVALRDEWAEFCPKWQSVLNKHDAQFFHFYDWSTASRVLRNIIKPPSRFLSNPYKDWTLAKLDDFFYELAEIAGSGDKIIAGGYV